MSKPINTQIPTAEILMATGVLREVGLDHEADKFRESLFNRDLLPAAVRALEQRIKGQSQIAERRPGCSPGQLRPNVWDQPCVSPHSEMACTMTLRVSYRSKQCETGRFLFFWRRSRCIFAPP